MAPSDSVHAAPPKCRGCAGGIPSGPVEPLEPAVRRGILAVRSYSSGCAAHSTAIVVSLGPCADMVL